MIYKLWKSKEVKDLYIMVLPEFPVSEDSVAISYEIDRLNPRRIHIYKKWYLDQFFEFSDEIVWRYNM